MKRQILLLTNSVKKGKSCIAGIDVYSGEWIRIVKNKKGEELYLLDFKILDKYGNLIQLSNPILSLIEIEIEKRVPHEEFLHQTENCIIKKELIYLENKEKEELENYVENPPDLWGNGDRLSLDEIKNKGISSSLVLIKVESIYLYLKDRSAFGQNPQRRVRFSYADKYYDLPLTDPRFKELREGKIENPYLVISLGEPFEIDNNCYKIVASVI